MPDSRVLRASIVRSTATIIGALLVAAGSMAWHPSAAGAAAGTVSITPGPVGGNFSDGQTVKVSVGPNSTFAPHSRVIILECADPGGDAAHLPTSLGNCDGNTVQSDTVLVQGDGSFTEANYTLYSLPSVTLGEQANWQPACDTTHQCVLFVGSDQNDFTKPKLFSQAFTIAAAGGAPAPVAAPATAAPTPTTTPPFITVATGASAQVSLAPATLAYTGSPGWLPLTAVIGVGLVLLAQAGRRWARGYRR